MKILIVLIHPHMSGSRVNKRWIKELGKDPDKYFVHDLHKVYPSENIDVAREQQLIEAYDKIIFQFPFYWFNCTPLFKKWLDEVLTYGWAYGSKSGYKMKHKKVALALSVGIDKQEYTGDGKYKYHLGQLLAPFELTFNYIKADYKGFFACYGLELNSSEEWIERSVPAYLDFVDSI